MFITNVLVVGVGVLLQYLVIARNVIRHLFLVESVEMVYVTKHKKNLYSITLDVNDKLNTKFFNSPKQARDYYKKLRIKI